MYTQVDHGTDNKFECYPKREALYQGHEAGMNLRCEPAENEVFACGREKMLPWIGSSQIEWIRVECIPKQDTPHRIHCSYSQARCSRRKVFEKDSPAVNQYLFCFKFRSCFGAVASKNFTIGSPFLVGISMEALRFSEHGNT